MSTPPGTLYTLSAPSGAGKTSLVQALLELDSGILASVSHTTRQQRNGEQHGVNYHFIDEPQFQQILARGGFLEHARVFDNWYGTSQDWVEQILEGGTDVILEIDWQGAQQVRRQIQHTVSIFVLPPSRHTLEQRLTGRGQDDNTIIEARMAQAQNEMSHYAEADYLLINDDFDAALNELAAIFCAHRLRLGLQAERYCELITDLLS